jgi:hypothetical protein
MSTDRRMLLRGALACACCFKAGAAIAADPPQHGGAAAGHAAHWSHEGDGSWTVHKEAVEASVEQIEKFASLFPRNARPAQRRNNRFLIDAS